MAFGIYLLVLAYGAVAAASPYVVQVHLNCNTRIKDNIFYFENNGACTTFPGFGSYQAVCSGTKRKFVRYATEDCSGEAQPQPLDTCIKLENADGQLTAQEHSVMYKCAGLPLPQYGMLESFPTGFCADTGAYSKRLGFNLNECVSSRLTQSGLFQKNTVFEGEVREVFYFDSQCTQPADGNPTLIPVGKCSILLTPASRYVVVNVPITKRPTTLQPTKQPASSKPTKQPTAAPSKKPTKLPTSKAPTAEPTKKPSKKPTVKPSKRPTGEPTAKPSKSPTAKPTKKPTKAPTAKPTKKTAA